MCGRFTLRTPLNLLVEQLMLDFAPGELPPRYNIAPTQPVAVVRQADDGQSRMDFLRWGLVPSWAKDTAISNRLINARAETVAEKPAFRAAFKRRRCLVPTDGYFEWQAQGKAKQPYLIDMQNGEPFAFAGLWESWQAPDGSPLETFTLITTDANETTRPIHDRMPVILSPEAHAMWLDGDFAARQPLLDLLVPFEAEPMRTTPVSRHVNNPRNDDPECVAVQKELF